MAINDAFAKIFGQDKEASQADVLNSIRAEVPAYRDLPDMELAKGLSEKAPDRFGFLKDFDPAKPVPPQYTPREFRSASFYAKNPTLGVEDAKADLNAFRAQSGAYKDVPDEDLASGLAEKFPVTYGHIPQLLNPKPPEPASPLMDAAGKATERLLEVPKKVAGAATDPEQVQRFGRDVAAGAFEAVPSGFQFIASMSDLTGDNEIGHAAQKAATYTRKVAKAIAPDDPSYYDQVAQAFGSTASLLVPTMGAAKAATFIPGIGRFVLANMGTAQSLIGAGLESAVEAGGSAETVLGEKGDAGRVEAGKAAAKNFMANFFTIALTNKLGLFNDKMKSEVGKMVASTSLETLQEGFQTAIDYAARGKPVDWVNVAQTLGVALPVAAMGGAVVHAMDHSTVPPEVVQKVAETAPALAQEISGKTFPVTQEVLQDAVKKGQDAGLRLVEASPMEAQVESVKAFTDAVHEATLTQEAEPQLPPHKPMPMEQALETLTIQEEAQQRGVEIPADGVDEVHKIAKDLRAREIETIKAGRDPLFAAVEEIRLKPNSDIMEEFDQLPRQFKPTSGRPGLPIDEVAQQLENEGELPPGSGVNGLIERLGKWRTRQQIPNIDAFIDQAVAIYQEKKAKLEPARAAAMQVLRTNQLDDKVAVQLVDEITADPQAFQEGYGREFQKDKDVIRGETQTLRTNAVIKLAEGATEFTGRHEAFHAVSNLLLTPAENEVVVRKYGDMEKAADAFATYRGGTSSGIRLIDQAFRKIQTFLERLGNWMKAKKFATAEDIFASIEAGKTAQREAEAKAAAGRQYSAEQMAEIPAPTSQNLEQASEEIKRSFQDAVSAGAERITWKVDQKSPFIARNLIPSVLVNAVEHMGGKIRQEGDTFYADIPRHVESVALVDPETKKQYSAEDMYTAVRTYKPAASDTLREYRESKTRSIKEFGQKLFVTMSSRLANIHPSLKHAMRKFEFDYRQAIARDMTAVKPLLDGLEKLARENPGDYKALDLAMKNRASNIVNAIGSTNGLDRQINKAAVVLDAIHDRMKDVGYEVGYIHGYFPRMIKDQKGFLAYMEKQGALWGELDLAIKEKENQIGRSLNETEKVNLINTFIRGFKRSPITLAKTGNMKTREIERVTPELNRYYYTTREAMVRYIAEVNEAIEARRFFGKVEGKPDLSESAQLALAGMSVAEKNESALSFNNIHDSIGAYVNRLLEFNQIAPEQQSALKVLFQDRFDYLATSGMFGTYKNLVYMDTIANPISALSQADDLGVAIYRSAVHSPGSFIRALMDKSKISLEDLNLDNLSEEVREMSRSSAMLRFFLRASGFSFMDRVGKETYLNTAIDAFRDEVRRGDSHAENRIVEIFGPKADQVIEDLKANKTTDDVLYLAFNELSESQPVTLSEMPEYYLKSPGARVFYALKTFMVKRLDFIRQEVMKGDTTPDKIKRFLKLYAILIAFGAGVDELKDFILGRKTSWSDRLIDNLLKPWGISKFTLYKARNEGPVKALASMIMPPAKFIESIWKDVQVAGEPVKVGNHMEPRKLEITASIPLGGKLWYWWYGRGRQKTDAKTARIGTPAQQELRAKRKEIKDRRALAKTNR